MQKYNQIDRQGDTMTTLQQQMRNQVNKCKACRADIPAKSVYRILLIIQKNRQKGSHNISCAIANEKLRHYWKRS